MDIKHNVSLAPYTFYKVGGAAKIYFKPQTLQELAKFIQTLPITEEIFFLGLGSNVLIRDNGIDGAVIHINNNLNNLKIIEKTASGILVNIEAGVSCAKIAKFCIQHNLAEGIWFAGIPGTMGGALHMNAGAFGGETWQHVRSVEVISRNGEIRNRLAEEYKISYRSVTPLKYSNDKIPEWFVSANLFFNFNIDAIKDNDLSYQVESLLRIRKSTQPIGTLNCGSVFKNPPNNWAGKLIENANLKGIKFGDAVVSEKHANFIINCGNAKAKDIEGLIRLIQTEVLAKFNILLEPEVKIVGEI